MKPTREELIEMAIEYHSKRMPYSNGDYEQWSSMIKMMATETADFALQVLSQHESQPEPQHESFRVRALRKRGTDLFYVWDGEDGYYEHKIPELLHLSDDSYYADYPPDAELVELECRVVKTVEP